MTGEAAPVLGAWTEAEAIGGPKRGPVRRLESVYMDEDEDGTRVECMTGECITGELGVVGGGNEEMRACFAAEEAVGVRTRENMSEADQLLFSEKTRWVRCGWKQGAGEQGLGGDREPNLSLRKRHLQHPLLLWKCIALAGNLI